MLVNPPTVLLLGQDSAALRALARTLALLCIIETRNLAGTAFTLPRRVDGVLIAAQGLRDDGLMHRAVAVLRPILARAIPVLALADDPKGIEAMRARVLGASTVLPSGLPARTLAASVTRALRPRSSRVPATEQAVQEAVLVLDELMRSASSGGTPAPDMAGNVATHMRQAIATDGATRLLDTVRTIHDRTYRHSLLVAGLMAGFCHALRFPDRDVVRLTTGALLHDVGKALIPTELIDKPGRLTDVEQDRMRQHVVLGHDLLAADGGHDPVVLSIVRSHHEYLDGSGYPDGLRASEISDPVRIATICDIFAALLEERSYKPALSAILASEQMAPMIGKLDADLLRAFEAVFVRGDGRDTAEPSDVRNAFAKDLCRPVMPTAALHPRSLESARLNHERTAADAMQGVAEAGGGITAIGNHRSSPSRSDGVPVAADTRLLAGVAIQNW